MLLLQPPTHTRENENENVNANAAWVSVSVHGNSIAVFQKELRVNRSIYMDSIASTWTKFSHQCPVQGMPDPWVYAYMALVGMTSLYWNII